MAGILSDMSQGILGVLMKNNPRLAGILGAATDPQFYKDTASNLAHVPVGMTAAAIGAPADIMSMGSNFKPGEMPLSTDWLLKRWYSGRNEGVPDTARIASMLPNDASDVAPLMKAIVSPAVASGLNTARKLPADKLFADAVLNTPGASITDSGLLMRLQRNQLPDQAMQDSVRGGVFYLPEGSANARHYGTGKTGYGGPERITGETQINNPIFVKGATGGKAPEAAYDSLVGKGAYQKMRTDALHWSGGPKEIREEAVSKFLEKYAPEMADQSWYILENSKHGNQLAYALQEAAVASAVRKAGHDAVLGYSLGRGPNKGKPTISEVFDVREKNYPDKFGAATDIWDQFLSRK